MKKYFKIYIVLLMISVSSLKAVGQIEEILGNFSAVESNGNVFLSWQIIEGNTCNGIQIYHSTDSITFERIGEFVGVCGSTTETVYYNFTDSEPEKNKVNYYKIELGNFGFSEVISVEVIDVESDGFQIQPHPITNKSRIFFKNRFSTLHYLTIYDIKGKLIQQMSGSTDFFLLEKDRFVPGIFFFTITGFDGKVKISDKIVVH